MVKDQKKEQTEEVKMTPEMEAELSNGLGEDEDDKE